MVWGVIEDAKSHSDIFKIQNGSLKKVAIFQPPVLAESIKINCRIFMSAIIQMMRYIYILIHTL